MCEYTLARTMQRVDTNDAVTKRQFQFAIKVQKREKEKLTT